MERLRRSKFYMDSITDNIDGYTLDHHWNGWACPYLPRESVNKVISGIQAFARKHPDIEHVAVTWDGDTLVLHESQYPDEPERVEPALLSYEGEQVELWPLGMYSWTWSESEDDLEVSEG